MSGPASAAGKSFPRLLKMANSRPGVTCGDDMKESLIKCVLLDDYGGLLAI